MTTQPQGALQQRLLQRALAAGAPGRLHLRFRADVVDRYRELASAEVMRTRTVGRIAVTGRWVGPPLFEPMALLDREVVLHRLRAAHATMAG